MKINIKEVFNDPVYSDFIMKFSKPGSEKLVAILLKLYEEVYKHTTPKLDFKKALKTGLTKKEGWFEKYTIDKETEDKILKDFFKGNRLKSYEIKEIIDEYELGSAPKLKK